MVTEKPKRPRKKRQAVTDASGSSHPPKKLRKDHGTSSGAATGGKSPSVLKELLASSMLNVKVGVATVATLPMITSSVSTTPEHESGVPIDSITGLNLRTIGASERFVISLDSSHHSSTNASGAEADSVIKYVVVPPVMIEVVVTSPAANVPSVPETIKADTMGPSYSAKQDLLMGSRELNSKTLHRVFVPQWNVLNDSLPDDYDVSREFVDHLAPPALFSQMREMDYHHLFTEFNVGTTRQTCLNAEVRMRIEYCLSERKRLESECEKQVGLLKAKDDEVAAAEATEKMHVDEIDALKQKNAVLENEKESLDGKVSELQSSVSTKDLELKDLNVDVSSLRS
ncbi:hypothetical protein Tco_0791130 [Tanacetum coccineum]